MRERYAILANELAIPDALKFQSVVEPDVVTLRQTLVAISGAVVHGDRVAIQIASEFVAANVYFHYSGYIRAGMARRLKSVTLNDEQKLLIRTGLLSIFESGVYGPEYRELCGLLRRIGFGSYGPAFKNLLNLGGPQRRIYNELFDERFPKPKLTQ